MNFLKKILISSLLTVGLLTVTGCSDKDVEQEKSKLDGMKILQVYGVGEAGGTNSPALSHSFIELYNTTDTEIDLKGSSIQYSSGGNEWSYLALDGAVPGNSSYLIKANGYGDFTKHEITNQDQNWNNVIIENKNTKVCLMDTTSRLAVVNPYNVNGNPVVGYVDMVGAAGSGADDSIDAYEGDFVVGQSKQKAVKRTSKNDSNNNKNDFSLIDYSSMPTSILSSYLPKTSSDGAHNPFEGKGQVETTNDIVIFQVYGTGNNTDTPINRSFVELYNKSNDNISLNGYSLQYINENNEIVKLDLNGTINAKSSFLIAGKVMSTGSTVNITIEDGNADMVCDWEIDNKILTLVLLSSTTILTNFDAYQEHVAGNLDSYVDMFGNFSDNTETNNYYYEGMPFTELSKQKSARRKSLDDSNNNNVDFKVIDYRLNKDYSLDELNNLAPKSTKNGQWSPFN